MLITSLSYTPRTIPVWSALLLVRTIIQSIFCHPKALSKRWGRSLTILYVSIFALAPPASGQLVEVEWLRQFGTVGPATGLALAIAVDTDGNIYVAGSTDGTMPGQTTVGGTDAFLRKYDAAGNEVWTRQFGTPGTDTSNAVSVDATGVYVAGQTAEGLPGQTYSGTNDAFVRKYDVDGNEVWTRQFGTPGFDSANGISVDASGVFVAGRTAGILPHQISVGGGTDAFLRKYDAAGNEVWTRQFGTPGFDSANGISVDASGVSVAGQTAGTLPGQLSAGGTDAFLRKYDAAGDEVWTRQFGTSAADLANGVSVDASGVYVAGQTTGVLPGQSIAGGTDAFVRKYDAAGNEVWTRQFGTSGFDSANGISVDASGVSVAGQTASTLPGQLSAGGTDAFLRRYDYTGNELWTRQFGTPGFDSANGISVDASGVSVAGQTAGTLPGQLSAGGTDAFLRRYDNIGNEVWTRQFDAPTAPTFDEATAVVVDGDGNVYVVGQTQGLLPGQFSEGFTDVFVRKYDDAGAEVWTRQFGTPGVDVAIGVSLDASGVYVAGGTTRTLTSADGWLNSNPNPGVTFDAFVRKYDANGNENWTRQFGTIGEDLANGISVDASGIYVAGHTTGALPGQMSASGTDAFVRKYDTAGAEVWTRQFGAPVSGATDVASGISVDASGVYVSGQTTHALPGQINPNPGANDAFVRKYGVDGSEVWTRQFGTSAADLANGVSVDASGVYVAGQTTGVLSGQSIAGGTDAFVRKYDAAGNEVWTRQFGTSGTDISNDVSIGASGGYIAGQTTGSLPSQTNTNPGTNDGFVWKFDVNGNEVWTHQFGSSSNDFANGVSVNASGAYVAGLTNGALVPLPPDGSDDAFIVKIAEIFQIAIDIKPGRFPNTVNLGSGGTVAVAILSTTVFDALYVDPITVTLSDAVVKLKGNGTPVVSFEDVNQDSLLDLIVHVNTSALQLSESDTNAVLEGETFDGKRVRGFDSIRVVP